MKRFLFILMILMLVFSVFTANSMLVFAEGEDSTVGTEGTLPDGEGTENGGEDVTPPATEEEKKSEENEDSSDKDELVSIAKELWDVLGDLKDEFVGIVKELFAFVASEDSYATIGGILIAVLAVIFIPILIGILAIAYIVVAMVVVVSSALMSLLEAIVGLCVGALLII